MKRETESGPESCLEGTRKGAQDTQGAFVMVLELTGSNDAHSEHFTIAGLCAAIGAMPHGAQQVVKHDGDGYHHGQLEWLIGTFGYEEEAV